MRYCIRITFTDNEFIPLSNFHRFRFTHADTSRLARPRLASPSAITRESVGGIAHRRSRATCLPAHSRACHGACNYRPITDRRRSGTLTLRIGHIHMLKIRLVALLVFDDLMHAHPRTDHRLILSLRRSFAHAFTPPYKKSTTL